MANLLRGAVWIIRLRIGLSEAAIFDKRHVESTNALGLISQSVFLANMRHLG